MSPSPAVPTLSDFFEMADLSPQRLEEIAGSEDFSEVRDELGKNLKGLLGSKKFLALMFQQLSRLLAIEVPDILVKGWRETEGIRQYADREKYPPEEEFLVPLAEHTLTSSHKPVFKPHLNEFELPEVRFDIDLSLEIEGAALRIRDGTILGINTGSCSGQGVVKLATAPIIERKSNRFELPGTLDLGEGVAIPRSETADTAATALGGLLGEIPDES